MATITEVRDALAEVVGAVDGLRAVKYPTDASNLPAALITYQGTEPQAMQRGTVTMQFDIDVIVSVSTTGRIPTEQLDDFVNTSGTRSIWEQIWNNRTLGIDVDAHVVQSTGYRQLDGLGIEHLASTLTVIVHTGGAS